MSSPRLDRWADWDREEQPDPIPPEIELQRSVQELVWAYVEANGTDGTTSDDGVDDAVEEMVLRVIRGGH